MFAVFTAVVIAGTLGVPSGVIVFSPTILSLCISCISSCVNCETRRMSGVFSVHKGSQWINEKSFGIFKKILENNKITIPAAQQRGSPIKSF